MERETRQAELAEKRRYWEEQVQCWRGSGLSQKEYCRQNQLPENRLTYWKKRFTKVEAPVSFVQVQFGGDGRSKINLSQGSGLRLIVGKKHEIEVARGFDPHVLWQLIHVLEGA